MQRTAIIKLFSTLTALALLCGANAIADTSTVAKGEVDQVVDAPVNALIEDADALIEDADALIEDADAPLEDDMESVKKALLQLKRDLVILEEDLLFPASTQVSVFLSMDIGELFALDAVTLELNGKEVAHHLYTDKQIDALYRGGIQKLYVGNVKQGRNRITAFFTGRGPSGRDYKRATTVEFEKSFEPTFVELAISDSTEKYQPEFSAAVAN